MAKKIINISEDDLIQPGLVVEAAEDLMPAGPAPAATPAVPAPAPAAEALPGEALPGEAKPAPAQTADKDDPDFLSGASFTDLTPDEVLKLAHKRLQEVPAWSRDNLPSIERANQFYTNLEKDISNSVRKDTAGRFTHEQLVEVDQIRGNISTQLKLLDRIQNSLEKRFTRADSEAGLVKEATTPVLTTVPDYFCYSVARAIGNAVASSGQDIEKMFKIASDKFKLDEREKFMVKQALYDMGRVIHAPLIEEIPYRPDNYLA